LLGINKIPKRLERERLAYRPFKRSKKADERRIICKLNSNWAFPRLFLQSPERTGQARHSRSSQIASGFENFEVK
jgi:hypothetical protein